VLKLIFIGLVKVFKVVLSINVATRYDQLNKVEGNFLYEIVGISSQLQNMEVINGIGDNGTLTAAEIVKNRQQHRLTCRKRYRVLMISYHQFSGLNVFIDVVLCMMIFST